MRAIGKYIVIEEVKETGTITKGGLMLSETQREDIRYRKAKVLNIGTDVVGVNNNDNIYFDRHAGFNIEIGEDVRKVIKEQDVVIVL